MSQINQGDYIEVLDIPLLLRSCRDCSVRILPIAGADSPLVASPPRLSRRVWRARPTESEI